jgi:hypothetical protein
MMQALVHQGKNRQNEQRKSEMQEQTNSFIEHLERLKIRGWWTPAYFPCVKLGGGHCHNYPHQKPSSECISLFDDRSLNTGN